MSTLTRRLPLGVSHPTAADRVRQTAVIAGTVVALIGAVVGSGYVGGTPIPEVAGGALGPDATLVAPAGPADHRRAIGGLEHEQALGSLR